MSRRSGAGHCVECGAPLKTDNIDGRPRGKCPTCGWIRWDHARPVVLVHASSPSGRIVLTRDARFPPGTWGLVAGYVEPGETLEAAALRELSEEAGLIGREARLLGSESSAENLILLVACNVDDGELDPTRQTDTERQMGTEVALAEVDLARIVEDSAAARFIERMRTRAGELARPVALALIRNRDALLVSEGYDEVKARRFFRPLGGTIEFGETAEEAVRRELREELGAELTDVRLLSVIENRFRYRGRSGHEVVFVHEASLEDLSRYRAGPLAAYEANGDPIKVSWRSLSELRSEAALVPEGLLALIDGVAEAR